MAFKEEDYLQLSGLQHFKFCLWTLIHIEELVIRSGYYFLLWNINIQTSRLCCLCIPNTVILALRNVSRI